MFEIPLRLIYPVQSFILIRREKFSLILFDIVFRQPTLGRKYFSLDNDTDTFYSVLKLKNYFRQLNLGYNIAGRRY